MSTSADRAASTLRTDLAALRSFAVPPRAGRVALDLMENPHSLPQHLQRELGERLGRVALNRYPDDAQLQRLREALAATIDMPPDCAVMLGNGSDELIRLLSLALEPGSAVLAPEPGFLVYRLAAMLHGLRYVGVSLAPDFELDEPAMLAAIERERPKIVWLACPNNPTANLWDERAIERIAEAAPGLVVMDEAYQPFASRDSTALLRRHAHVLLLRTMSKLGLAGARIGCLVGRAPLVAEIDKLRPPFNVSALDAEAALFALEHADEYAAQAAAIRAERGRLHAALAALPGAKAWPSEANMIVVRLPDVRRACAALLEAGVLVKSLDGTHPLLANCLRLTVGTPAENERVLQVLRASA